MVREIIETKWKRITRNSRIGNDGDSVIVDMCLYVQLFFYFGVFPLRTVGKVSSGRRGGLELETDTTPPGCKPVAFTMFEPTMFSCCGMKKVSEVEWRCLGSLSAVKG